MSSEVTIVALETDVVEIGAFQVAERNGYAICSRRVREPTWNIYCVCSERRCQVTGSRSPERRSLHCPLVD